MLGGHDACSTEGVVFPLPGFGGCMPTTHPHDEQEEPAADETSQAKKLEARADAGDDDAGDDSGDGGGNSGDDEKSAGGGQFRRGGKKPIGFAAIDPNYQRELASRGGKRAQEERGPAERSEIGRRGGHAAQEERNPEERSEIGRMGGRARWDEGAREAVQKGEYRRGGRRPM